MSTDNFSQPMKDAYESGLSHLMQAQEQKIYRCMEFNQMNMDEFVNCYNPFHKNFNEINGFLKQKINFSSTRYSNCLTAKKLSPARCGVEGKQNIIDSFEGAIKDIQMNY